MLIPISLTSNDEQFIYLLEYINSSDTLDTLKYTINTDYQSKSIGCILGYCDTADTSSYLWNSSKNDTQILYNIRSQFSWQEPIEYAINYKVSNIYLYWPDYDILKKETLPKYILKISIKINSTVIQIGCFELIRQRDSLACSTFHKKNNNYQEYTQFTIIDPIWLSTADDASIIRKTITGDSNPDFINAGNLIYALYHVTDIDDNYEVLDTWSSGQSTYIINNTNNIIRQLYIGECSANYNTLIATLSCNDIWTSIESVMSAIYNITITDISCQLYISNITLDSGEDYDFLGSCVGELDTKTDTKLVYIFPDLPDILDWSTYKCGSTCAIAIYTFTYNDTTLILRSNRLPITPNIFGVLKSSIFLTNEIIENIDSMSIRIYNKNEITLNEAPDITSQSSGLIQPIFYRVTDSASIVIHPDITEQIAINLNAYKSKVDYFILQIEGIKFTEYARTNSGIIFRVIGSSLPQELTEGTYYILNEDSELVTSGAYTYIN